MFSFAPERSPRRPSLTPMIDVVFLLLVFFMLAAQFGVDRVVPLQAAAAGTGYSGPPRLVTVTDQGLRLNGQALEDQALIAELQALMQGPQDVIVLQADDKARLQDLTNAASLLSAAGFTALAVVE